MAEPAASSGRPAGSGSSRSSAIRRGFEPYNPGSRLASSARGKGRSTGGGHDMSRGHALWEDDREPTRGSRVEKEWKHDMFETGEGADPPRGGNSANGGVRVRGRGATRAFASSSTAAEAEGGGGRSGGAPPAAVEVETTVPSEERYEDLSRRVEEEVVAKLARAQMMGMMLKAHREQQQQHHGHQAVEKRRARGGGGGVRREGGSGSGLGNQSSRRSRAGSSSRKRSGGPSPEPSAVVGVPSAAAPPLVPTVAAVAPARGLPAAARDDARLMVGPTTQGRGYAGPPPTRKPSPPPHRSEQGRGDPRPAGLLKVSPEVLAAGTPAASPSPAEAIPEKKLLDGVNLEEMSLGEAYVTVGKIEQRHKALAAQLRREIGHFGETPGVELLFRRVSWVRDALSQTLGSLVQRDPTLSLRKRLPNRLWMAHYRALEVVQHRLRQLGQHAAAEASSAGGGTGSGAQQMRQAKQRRQKQRQALRTRLFELIEEAERNLWGMVETVERQMVEAKSRIRQAAASPTSSQYSSSLSSGRSSGASDDDDDFGSNLHDASSGGEPTEGSEEEGSDAEGREEEKTVSNTHEVLGRQLAVQAFLTSLGDLCRYRGLYAEAVSTGGNGGGGGDDRSVSWSRAEELYRRALRVDPSSGKVWNQMAVLASCRQDNLEAFYAYLRGLCAAVPYPAGRESLLVLHENCKARLSTVRAATALDALGLEEHRARFRLYLLGACGTCLSRVDLGAFDGYLALSERHMVSCVQLYLMRSDTDRGDGGGNGLEGTLARAIVLCICTASAAFEAWRARDAENGSWTTDPATSRAVRLCMSLAASLAGLHRKTTRRGWEQVTAAGVSVFLDWLTCRPQFGEGARGTRLDEFQHAMACVVEFANGVIRSASVMGGGRGNGNGNAAGGISLRQPREKTEEGEEEVDPDGALWEDEECRGLPALAVVAERRAAKAQRKPPSKTSIPRRRRPLPEGDGNSSSLSPADATPTSMETLTNDRGGRGSSRGVTNRGGKGRRGEVSGRRRPANSSSRTRTTSWAAEDDHCLVTSGAGGGGEGVVNPWKIRVARIRKQVEFCVERGWISRGNRAGTYTLPKPPPSSAMRHSSPRAGDTLAPSDQQRREGSSGGVSGSLWVESNDASSGRKGKGKGGGGRGGNGSLSLSQPSPRRDEGRAGRQQKQQQPRAVPLAPSPGKPDLSQTPPQAPTVKPPSGPMVTAMANGHQTSGNGVGFGADAGSGLTGTVPMGDSVAKAEAAAVAQALSSLHLEMRAQEEEQEEEDSGGGDALRSTNSGFGAAPVRVPPPPPTDIEQGFSNSSNVIYPGTVGGPNPGLTSSVQQQQHVLSDTTGGFYPGTMICPDSGMVSTIQQQQQQQQQQQSLSDSMSVLYPGTIVGPDPRMATAEAATSAAMEPTGGIVMGGVDEDNPLPESLLGIVLAGLGSAEENLCQYCCATLEPGAVECSTCGTPTQAATAEDPATAMGQAAVTAVGLLTSSPRTTGRSDDVPQVMALPAGVLAVDNLAEVIASSQRTKSPMPMPSGGGGRARAREVNDPTSIARAGLGDGGARARSVPVTGGGKMFGWPRGAPRSSALPLVVIDVPNVAMRHGLNKRFSCKGMQMAVEYFRTAGHRVVGFLPDYLLDQKRTNGLERAKKLGVAEVKASRLPDDIPLLQRLVDDGIIVATPPQDYDDSYCIKYAMAKDGYLVTNDLYRDHVKGVDGRKKADAARRWIKSHSISYTFVGDEFFPNPDFSFHQGQQGGGGPP